MVSSFSWVWADRIGSYGRPTRRTIRIFRSAGGKPVAIAGGRSLIVAAVEGPHVRHFGNY
jgi:hypothetical protein